MRKNRKVKLVTLSSIILILLPFLLNTAQAVEVVASTTKAEAMTETTGTTGTSDMEEGERSSTTSMSKQTSITSSTLEQEPTLTTSTSQGEGSSKTSASTSDSPIEPNSEGAGEDKQDVASSELITYKNFITSQHMMIDGKDIASNPEVKINSDFRLSYDFELTNQQKNELIPNQPYPFTLPELSTDVFKLVSSQDIPLLDKNGVTFGYIKVKENGQAIATFLDEIKGVSDVKGNFAMDGHLNKEKLTNSEKMEVEIPHEGNNNNSHIEIPITKESLISKKSGLASGLSEGVNSFSIPWTITVNEAGLLLKNGIVTDTLPPHLKLIKESFKIEPTPEIPDSGEKSDDVFNTGFNSEGQEFFTYKLPKGTDKKYTITFNTKVDLFDAPLNNQEFWQFINNASLADGEFGPIEASAEAHFSSSINLDKYYEGQHQDKDKNSIYSWKLKFIPGANGVPKGTTFEEVLSDNQVFTTKDGSTELNDIKEELAKELPGVSFDIEISEKTPNIMKITFPKGLQNKSQPNYFLDVYSKKSVKEPNKPISNTLQLGGKEKTITLNTDGNGVVDEKGPDFDKKNSGTTDYWQKYTAWELHFDPYDSSIIFEDLMIKSI